MNNFNDEVFEFKNDDNKENIETDNFNYDSISGLGESNYENEDLFKVDEDKIGDSIVAPGEVLNSEISDIQPNSFTQNENNETGIYGDVYNSEITYPETVNVEEDNIEDYLINPDYNQDSKNITDNYLQESDANVAAQPEVQIENFDDISQANSEIEEQKTDDDVKIEMSGTPIDELNKLTEYTDDNIETTDIGALFDKVNVNVKEASDIFRKNTEMKQKIDSRFNELKQLQSEVENSKKAQIDQINEYKEEVLRKLTEKKGEIENRLNLLKELQSSLEKEKKEFEQYKKSEQEKIDKVQKEVQAAYDDRREELGHIEDVLRKQKDALDEERNQLSLDRIKYESDKNELANNLLKFNEIVNSFTNGVDDIKN